MRGDLIVASNLPVAPLEWKNKCMAALDPADSLPQSPRCPSRTPQPPPFYPALPSTWCAVPTDPNVLTRSARAHGSAESVHRGGRKKKRRSTRIVSVPALFSDKMNMSLVQDGRNTTLLWLILAHSPLSPSTPNTLAWPHEWTSHHSDHIDVDDRCGCRLCGAFDAAAHDDDAVAETCSPAARPTPTPTITTTGCWTLSSIAPSPHLHINQQRCSPASPPRLPAILGTPRLWDKGVSIDGLDDNPFPLPLLLFGGDGGRGETRSESAASCLAYSHPPGDQTCALRKEPTGGGADASPGPGIGLGSSSSSSSRRSLVSGGCVAASATARPEQRPPALVVRVRPPPAPAIAPPTTTDAAAISHPTTAHASSRRGQCTCRCHPRRGDDEGSAGSGGADDDGCRNHSSSGSENRGSAQRRRPASIQQCGGGPRACGCGCCCCCSPRGCVGTRHGDCALIPRLCRQRRGPGRAPEHTRCCSPFHHDHHRRRHSPGPGHSHSHSQPQPQPQPHTHRHRGHRRCPQSASHPSAAIQLCTASPDSPSGGVHHPPAASPRRWQATAPSDSSYHCDYDDKDNDHRNPVSPPCSRHCMAAGRRSTGASQSRSDDQPEERRDPIAMSIRDARPEQHCDVATTTERMNQHSNCHHSSEDEAAAIGSETSIAEMHVAPDGHAKLVPTAMEAPLHSLRPRRRNTYDHGGFMPSEMSSSGPSVAGPAKIRPAAAAVAVYAPHQLSSRHTSQRVCMILSGASTFGLFPRLNCL